MPTKARRMTAVAVAFTVWLVYSVPAHAAPTGNSSKNILAGSVLQVDDDDDDLSGGALAVLLLAIGGAVAGVLYAGPSRGTTNSLALSLIAGSTARVSIDGTDTTGKKRRGTWTASLDRSSGMITLTMEGTDRGARSRRSQWTGKVDGTYYPVKGDSRANEYSFTKVDSRTLAFSARKAGRVTRTGRIVVSANGRSFTISKNKINPLGRRLSRQITYSVR